MLQGAEASEVEQLFASLELHGTCVVRCAGGDVVAWAPGIDAGGAIGLENAVISGKVKARDVVPPDATKTSRSQH